MNEKNNTLEVPICGDDCIGPEKCIEGAYHEMIVEGMKTVTDFKNFDCANELITKSEDCDKKLPKPKKRPFRELLTNFFK